MGQIHYLLSFHECLYDKEKNVYVYTQDFSFYIGSIYNIIATKSL